MERSATNWHYKRGHRCGIEHRTPVGEKLAETRLANHRSLQKWFGFSKYHYSLDSYQSLSYIHHMVSLLLSIEAENFCVLRKMEKSEFRTVIKHLYLKGLTLNITRYSVIAPVERRNQEKTSSFEKDPLSSKTIKIRIITTSTVITGFGPRWLFLIYKLEKMALK